MSKQQSIKVNGSDTFALMVDNYGPFKSGCSYKIIGEGFDWVLLRNQGSNIHVNRNLIHPNPAEFMMNNAEDDEEDIYDFYYNEEDYD